MKEINMQYPSLDHCEHVLKKLVQIDSCQPQGNEADMVRLIQTFLPDTVSCVTIEHSPGRVSLIARVEGEDTQGGIALIGHTDTVACNDLNRWTYPPHQAQVENGRLFGRGASDMKGGIAAMILTIQKLTDEGCKPKRPVIFCFTADEESGGMGIRSMVEGGYLEGIEEVIICEPSGEKIGICEKGALWLRVVIQGVASHASRPELGQNAIEHAILYAEGIKRQIIKYGTHAILGASTVSITQLKGGIMTNIIPSEAQMELDIRTVPGVSHDEILAVSRQVCIKMAKEHPGVEVTVEVLNNRPALENQKNSEFIRRIYEAAVSYGISTEPKGMRFYTDASQMLPKIPVPFVVAGPGEDSAAHTINESIALDSVARYTAFYCRYLEKHYM